MISRFSVKNYKSLMDVNVNLFPLTVVLGPNSAGKSNLFDALNLVARLVTKKNIKEAFESHRGLPIESISYSEGDITDLKNKENHIISFEIDVVLTEQVVLDVEQRIRDLRKRIDTPHLPNEEKPRVTEKYLRYRIELDIQPETGIVRVIDEALVALRKNGEVRSRNPFISKSGGKIRLRMEGQSHPTFHDVGLDYTIVSTPLYAPHYPHITAFREELSRCLFYYFEPRKLMRESNAIADVTTPTPEGGELAAFYHTVKVKKPKHFESLKLAARQILPRLTDLDIQRTEKAELFLKITEDSASYSNQLISEGTLRVLGLLAILSPITGASTVGYEEPENGVHPRRLQNIAELLRNAADGNRQILVNTHSPILPTYFSDTELLVCQRRGNGTEFVPFKSFGVLYKEGEISKYLEERIIRGDYGG